MKAQSDPKTGSAVTHIEILSDTKSVCVQKFNELVQKVEITNRILLDSRPCDQRFGNYSADIYVARI